ncbi:hypothetical protein ACFYUY_22355 [Kitasatospora sp. NPDC004745]|uniref:hypothetical protein n=1 Tax=unclassified Kitasatospora TaxID=2633591 RepID=UPI0033DD2997
MVDLALAALAAAAAGKLVELLTTDGWEAAKASVPALWRHARAEQVHSDLTDTRLALTQATDEGTAVQLRVQLAQEWQDRFARLLADRPEAAEEVRRVVDALNAPAAPQVTMRMDVSGGGDGYMAARDITVNRRDQT